MSCDTVFSGLIYMELEFLKEMVGAVNTVDVTVAKISSNFIRIINLWI